MRILALIIDAFGGNGGIALYNRDLLTALCGLSDFKEVVAIPLLMRHFTQVLPKNLFYVIQGGASKIKYLINILQVLRSNPKFDLLICGHINLLPVAHLLQILLKIPLVLEIHGIEAWKPSRKLYLNYFVTHIDAFVSVSEVTKRRFLRWAKLIDKQGFVLPNAIHLDQYGSGPKNQALLERYRLKGKTVLMTLGRLHSSERYKGIDAVIELLSELAFEIPNIAYLVVGEGDDRKRLMEKAATIGMAERVVFTGYIPEDEKAEYYRLADAFVMPGKGEGFGFVFLEAMACGIPVVASKIDGSREAVLGGKLGVIVDPNYRNEIKAGILKALKYPKGVPDELEYFSFENFTKRLHSILDNLIELEIIGGAI